MDIARGAPFAPCRWPSNWWHATPSTKQLAHKLAGFVGVRGERRAEIGKARPGFSLEPVELDGIAPRTPGDAR
jgi:hypothetical protein